MKQIRKHSASIITVLLTVLVLSRFVAHVIHIHHHSAKPIQTETVLDVSEEKCLLCEGQLFSEPFLLSSFTIFVAFLVFSTKHQNGSQSVVSISQSIANKGPPAFL